MAVHSGVAGWAAGKCGYDCYVGVSVAVMGNLGGPQFFWRDAMRRVGLAVVVLAAVAFLATPGFAADEVYDRVLPLAAGGSLVLQNVTGTITIVGWDRDAVEVHAVKTA